MFNTSIDNIPWIQNQLPFQSADSGRSIINYGPDENLRFLINSSHPLARHLSDTKEIVGSGLDYRNTITSTLLKGNDRSRLLLTEPEESIVDPIRDSQELLQVINDPTERFTLVNPMKAPLMNPLMNSNSKFPLMDSNSKFPLMNPLMNSNSSSSMFSSLMNKQSMDSTNEPSSMNSTNEKEGFSHPLNPRLDYNYLRILQSRAMSLCYYMRNNKYYNKFSGNWKLLEKNLNRNNYLFERLEDSDTDIAYVINKGDEVKFRVRDSNSYVPINIYQYVLYHEMAHMSTNEKQHTPMFFKLMSVIILAAFENGFIRFDSLPTSEYLSDGQPIVSKSNFKTEILEGAELLSDNEEGKKYFSLLTKHIKQK